MSRTADTCNIWPWELQLHTLMMREYGDTIADAVAEPSAHAAGGVVRTDDYHLRNPRYDLPQKNDRLQRLVTRSLVLRAQILNLEDAHMRGK